MKVWILKDAEPLPLKPGQRAMRSGLLAKELGRRGHQVLWWTSTFSHHKKELIFKQDTDLELMPNVTLRALDVGGYQRNISIARLLHHRRLGRRFREMAPREALPDVIVSSLPIIDLPYEAAEFAKMRDIPWIIDVRDPWPDVFVDKAPARCRFLVRWLTSIERKRATHALASADAVTAVSKGFLRWALRLAGREQREDDHVYYLGHSGLKFSADDLERSSKLTDPLAGKIVLTFVGTFGHSYELGLVAEAASYFNQKVPDIAFVLVGEGHQRAKLSERFSGLPNLFMPGWQDTREIAAILAKSHVGLVPCRSLPDTVPNKPFEYMAAGLPLLSSLQGEMADIIKSYDLGLSYPEGDLAGFIAAVKTIVGDRHILARWSSNATKAFNELFNAARIYPDFADYVLRLTERSRGVRAGRTAALPSG